jgi:hypothetical protein
VVWHRDCDRGTAQPLLHNDMAPLPANLHKSMFR